MTQTDGAPPRQEIQPEGAPAPPGLCWRLPRSPAVSGVGPGTYVLRSTWSWRTVWIASSMLAVVSASSAFGTSISHFSQDKQGRSQISCLRGSLDLEVRRRPLQLQCLPQVPPGRLPSGGQLLPPPLGLPRGAVASWDETGSHVDRSRLHVAPPLCGVGEAVPWVGGPPWPPTPGLPPLTILGPK
eukprot:2675706-Amphidinium_carterae.1